MGWEVSFFAVAVLGVVATPVEGGGPTLPLWGRVVTWMIVSCVGVVDIHTRYSCVNFFVRMSGAILANYARLIRDIHRDTVEIWEIHARWTRADLSERIR